MVVPFRVAGCPLPGQSLDWEAVLSTYPWLHELANTPQDPIHHAEGDVLTHTRMVAEALVELAGWQALPTERRQILLAAALFHDIAKPSCTVINANRRIESPGHARRGAGMARRMLWEAELDFATREAIVTLVRLHALPIWLVEREDSTWQAAQASWRCSLHELALLAEADMRGRICADQPELLLRIDYFREFCAELGCLNTPLFFPSEHSRVRYLRRLQADLHYHAFDDTWGEVTVMAGLPGAGKDSWISANAPNLPVVSLDALREQMRIDPTDEQGAVVNAAKEQARVYLRARQPFIWNATNISRLLRDPLIDLILNYAARVRIVYCETSRSTLLQRNRERAASVPAAVIDRLLDRLEPPDLTEAHHVVLNS